MLHTKKQSNLVKNSFTLLETLLALMILLVMIAQFSNIIHLQNDHMVYKELELAHNELTKYGMINTHLQHINFK
jgi:type II secretory pathway component PulJ